MEKEKKKNVKRLSAPILSKFFKREGDDYFKVSFCACQGFRPTMEDGHVISMSLSNHPNYHLFGIFDGHNGKVASQYLSKHLTEELNALSDLTDAKMIRECVMKMDKKFCQKNAHPDHGSTMVFALVRPLVDTQGKSSSSSSPDRADDNTSSSDENKIKYEVSVHWAGDSRCLWIRGDQWKELTRDHVPTNSTEKERIENANGTVDGGRVDHRLAMSRAFGDQSLKDDTERAFDEQKVISLCDHCPIFSANTGDWLLIFCDGLVETWSNETLAKKLKKLVKTYDDPAYALGFLFDEILEAGSQDNMSACLVQFQNGKDYAADNKGQTFLPGPLYKMLDDKIFVKAYMENANLFGHADDAKLRIAAYQEDIKHLKKRRTGNVQNEIAEIEQRIEKLRQGLSDSDTH